MTGQGRSCPVAAADLRRWYEVQHDAITVIAYRLHATIRTVRRWLHEADIEIHHENPWSRAGRAIWHW